MKKLKELLKDRTATYVEKTPEDVYREVASDPENNLSVEDVAAIGGMNPHMGNLGNQYKEARQRVSFNFNPERQKI